MSRSATEAEGSPGSLLDALAMVGDAMESLITQVDAGGLECADPQAVGKFAARFERLRNVLPLVDHAIVKAVTSSGLVQEWSASSPRQLLRMLLRISGAEASRRVKAAEQVGVRSSETGLPLAPLREVVATAQRAGEMTVEQVQVIATALAPFDNVGFDPAAVLDGEQILVDAARSGLPPEDLRGLSRLVENAIHPDGSVPDDDLNEARRYVRLRQNGDGTWLLSGRLTGIAGSRMHALLTTLARPEIPSPAGGLTADHALPGSPTDDDTTLVATLGGSHCDDTRSHDQRMHDALDQSCDRLLAEGARHASGGSPATVIVTVDQETLTGTVPGWGMTSDGTPVSAATARQLVNRADTEIFTAVLGSVRTVLDLGRTRRIASRAQVLALIVRDGGCSFPGCDRPPEWCERHHITAWMDGGPTDLDNLTLLCRFHHHNHANRGWTCRVNSDRLPEWIPPPWVDPEQRPLLNRRILTGLLTRPA